MSIHQTILFKNSLPFPFTRLFTIAPSMLATLTLISVRITKKKLWLISSRASLLLHPGTTIFSSRSSARKNSLFSSTFFRSFAAPSPSSASPPLSETVPLRAARCDASRWEAAFCSETAWRMRFASATKRVSQTAREMRVRLAR